ncbi:MAG: GAF domain-containing protein [Armatimonadetes bacterium]|nr:GAF domain-containing protein [Armatimonadota bacterium]
MQYKSAHLQPILQNVLAEAVELLGAQSGSLMLLDPGTNELRISVAHGLPPDVIQRVRVRPGEGIAGWVLAHNRARLLKREERAADSLSSADRLASAISAPLRVERRTIGVLNVSGSRDGDFTRADVRVLMAFAGQAASAIENARLSESLQLKMHQLSALHRVGQALTSTLNLSRVLREVLRRATSILGARCGSIMLLSNDGQELRIASAVGLDRKVVRETRLAIGQGIAGVVAQSGVSIVLDKGTVDVRSASGRAREHADAAMCVPLRFHGRTIGVINISGPESGDNFGEEHLDFLTTLADQAAIAIENARLYRRLEQRVNLANRELIRANHLLAQEKSKIQAIVDGMADGVLVTNRQGRITFINPTAETMLSIPAAQAVGKGLKHWPAGKSLMALLEEAQQSDGMTIVKEVLVPGEERRVLSANISPQRDERGRPQGFIAVLTDITALKEISDAKTELVSFVSHELRTPITSIQGFAQTMRDAAPGELDRDLQNEFLDIILTESGRLLSMIGEMLDVSRMEAGRGLHLSLAPVDIPGLLQRAVTAQKAYTSRHDLVLQVEDGLPEITADADKVYQVVINLLSNAIKYSPNGGTVTTAALARGDRVRVSVTDQGLGIPPEMIGKLFQRYYRVETKAHTSIKGTGLGLFFVKGVVEAHGGAVWVESQLGKGSRFVFELPVLGPPERGA